jgi:RecB family endonuclease NucS
MSFDPQTARWLELWTDVPAGGDTVLLVAGLDGGRVVILDLRRGEAEVAAFDDYADAKAWLNEDEYDLVEGRFAPKWL